MVESLKGEAAQKAFFFWKACIYSGRTVKLQNFEGDPVALGYCTKKARDVDFEIECGHNCMDYRMVRVPPKHERTATRKARIGTARRRSIANRKELFDLDKWKVPGTKKC